MRGRESWTRWLLARGQAESFAKPGRGKNEHARGYFEGIRPKVVSRKVRPMGSARTPEMRFGKALLAALPDLREEAEGVTREQRAAAGRGGHVIEAGEVDLRDELVGGEARRERGALVGVV